MTIAQNPFVLMTLIALLPALLCWWSGRRLARNLDDPLLPERLLAHHRRNGVVFAIAFIGLGYVSPPSAIWTLPLLFVAVLAAAYPLRRVLYQERWGLGEYLMFFVRLIAGLFAFWIVLASTPFLAAMAGRYAWLAGAVLGCLLLAWHARHAELLRRCLRTKPLEEGPFLSRCRVLAAACDVPAPRFEQIDLRGGVVANANALALPSLSVSSVLFTDTLLARLSGDEATAICAHELAHLEYYNRRRLRRLQVVTCTLIGLAAIIAPASRLAGFESILVPNLLWFVILLVALVLRAKDKQRQETVCDARAVALTGGAEPLVQALTKLYAIARIPRRVESQQERSGTHPSLARRIRDIRKAAGVTPGSLIDAATFTSLDGRTVVTMDDVAVHWAAPGAITHSVRYADLAELRIDAGRSQQPRLIAVVAGAKCWQMPIAPADVARAQSVLDRVDGKLGEHGAASRFPFAFGRLFIGFVAMLTLALGHVAVAFVALLAWIRPAPRLLVAAGVASLTAAALTLRGDPFGGVTLIMTSIVAAAGLALLGVAFTNRHETSTETRVALALLTTAAVLVMPVLALNASDVIRLHQAASSTPSAAILLLAVASAFACSQTRRAKVTAGAVAVLATCTVGAASPAFLDTFGNDPFLVDVPALEWTTLDSRATEEFEVPLSISRIWLSRDGRYVAALEQPDSEDDVTSRVHVGRVGEPLTAFPANDVAFVDEDHLLLVDSDQDGTTLREMTLNSSHDVVWRQRVRDLQGASLDFQRDSGRWTLTGWDDEAMVRAAGIVGDGEIEQKRWPAEYTRFAAIDAIATAGPQPVVVETRHDGGAVGQLLLKPRWLWAVVLLPHNMESRYWLLGEHGRTPLGESRFGADCTAGAMPDGALVCIVYDGTRSRLLRIDGGTGAVSGIGYLDGRFITDHTPASGWLIGWASATPVAIELSTKRVLRLPASERMIGHLTVAGQRLAAAVYEGESFKVRTWLIH